MNEGTDLSFHITKQFATSRRRLEFSFEAQVRNNEFIAVVGKTGAGKTTLLRMLCGLLKPDSGFIKYGESVWYDGKKGINLPPRKRGVGMVFQDYGLFPNMTVRENILFAAGRKNKTDVDNLMSIAGLDFFADMYPVNLSGGQKQRVALIRTIVNRPRVLLLDEPLAALDQDTRINLQKELLSIHNRYGVTSIMVTHELSEVFLLANRVMKIENGHIGTFNTPETTFSSKLSAKLSLTGVVVSIEPYSVYSIITVCIGNSLTKILIDPEESRDLKCGDHVLVASKAFNPVVVKL